jgi:hypothetical protein
MNTKKLIKWALYYTAAASVYNNAVNMWQDSTGASAPPIPLLPNPAAAILNNVMGANAPALLDHATGNYGWG